MQISTGNIVPSTLAIMFTAALLVPLSSSFNSAAHAKPKRADGGKCESVGTERRDGKDQDGNTINCKWDTCTYTECKTTGGKVGSCVKKTEYSNPTDCKAAAATGTNGGVLQGETAGTIAEPISKPKMKIRLPRGIGIK